MAARQKPQRRNTKLLNRTVPLHSQEVRRHPLFISYDNLPKQGSLPEGSLPNLMRKNDYQHFIKRITNYE